MSARKDKDLYGLCPIKLKSFFGYSMGKPVENSPIWSLARWNAVCLRKTMIDCNRSTGRLKGDQWLENIDSERTMLKHDWGGFSTLWKREELQKAGYFSSWLVFGLSTVRWRQGYKWTFQIHNIARIILSELYNKYPKLPYFPYEKSFRSITCTSHKIHDKEEWMNILYIYI